MRRLLLVGGGHAHVHVLDSLGRRPIADLDVTLVSPYVLHHYSGMVPGYVRGAYDDADLTIDLPRLCRRANARFVQAYADTIDGPGRTVGVAGETVEFDLASLDVGSDAANLDVPGAAEHAWTVRPMSRVEALRDRLDAILAEGEDGPVPICVVGAGAAGVEVSLGLHRRVRDAGREVALTLFNAGPDILPDYADTMRERAVTILEGRGITLRPGCRVSHVESDAVVDETGRRTPSRLTAWLTGAAPVTLMATSTLPKDDDGFFLVDPTLRSADGAPIWGAGDCIGIEGHPPLPKAGVFAVRQSPVLDRNMRAYLSDDAPARYDPQSGFLAILNTADGKALLRWRSIVSHSRWAWWLKDWIDRRFMAKYR